jgi:hypothetical protein
MILTVIKRIVAFVSAVAVVAGLPTASSQTITVNISQQANGVQFAFTGKLTELPPDTLSLSFPPNDGDKNRLELYNLPGFQSVRLFSSNDIKYYDIYFVQDGITSSQYFPCWREQR